MTAFFEIVDRLAPGEHCLCRAAQGQLMRTAYSVDRQQIILCENCARELADGLAVLRQGSQRRELLAAHARELADARAETSQALAELERVRVEFASARDTYTNQTASSVVNEQATAGLVAYAKRLEKLCEEEGVSLDGLDRHAFIAAAVSDKPKPAPRTRRRAAA